MYIENNINSCYTTWASKVDNNEMVELPNFCQPADGEEFLLIANNENSALVVPLDMISDKQSTLDDNLEKCKYELEAKGVTDELIGLYSSIILKVDAIRMAPIAGKEERRYGIKLGFVRGFLDKPNPGEDECVIFQNVNGVLIMHYGVESFKKNVSASAEVRRKK